MKSHELWKIGKLLSSPVQSPRLHLISQLARDLPCGGGRTIRKSWLNSTWTEAPEVVSSDDLYLFRHHGVATCRTASFNVRLASKQYMEFTSYVFHLRLGDK